MGRQRLYLPVLVSKMHCVRNKRSGVSPLLEGVAVAYYRVAHARRALERIPSLRANANFRNQLHRLQSYTFQVWDRLGLYYSAAQWAQKGLAIVAMNFAAPAGPVQGTPFARLGAQIASKCFLSFSLSRLLHLLLAVVLRWMCPLHVVTL